MISAMDSQLEYIQNYRESLQLLEKAGLDKSILAELSDGTAESAGYIQALVDDMAKNGGDSIDEINNKFAEIEKAKGEFADTVAEMQTDFTEKMTALETQLNTTVENMNKSDEAASAGASTMQAFADAAAGKQSAVESAFAKVAAAAMRKLSLSLNFPGFAGGTENAPEGFAMVGENGPELVYLNGGEKIMDASETQRTMDKLTPNAEPVTALQSSGNGGNVYSIDFKPQFNLSGSSNTEELRAMLEEQTENMRGQLEEMLDEIENDRTRRKYA
jgi:SLT domain-containing protein